MEDEELVLLVYTLILSGVGLAGVGLARFATLAAWRSQKPSVLAGVVSLVWAIMLAWLWFIVEVIIVIAFMPHFFPSADDFGEFLRTDGGKQFFTLLVAIAPILPLIIIGRQKA